MKNRAQRWALAVGYVGFIYATLGAVRAPVSYLRSHGLLRISLAVLYVGCYAGLLSVLVKTRPLRLLLRFLGLTGLFFIYYLVATSVVKLPEEQIHFFEYGLVGVFFLRALVDDRGADATSVFQALALAAAAGWLDEILQGLLPSRHYDVRDIFLNIVSAVLGLLVYGVMAGGGASFPRKRESRP